VRLTVALLLMSVMTTNAQTKPQTRAELTAYAETSRYADVMSFISELQTMNGSIGVETFGITAEGRKLPLVILSKQRVRTPSEAHSSGKPIVFIMANIHAGEVEGKEATLHLMREIVNGRFASVLDKIILLVAPIYNADGNERIDIHNRTAQNGPTEGVGTRENAKGLDLNRDFMKVESPEARGLIENVFNRWDPHVVIDLHTTDGSYHGYALTFSPCLNPNADVNLTAFARERLLPEVRGTMLSKYNYQTYFYGNFVDEKNPARELGGEAQGDPKAWATFDHRPRFGNNYVGLRNRLAILSEAYSYLDFRSRVDVTDKFVRTILQYVASHADDVVRLVRSADKTAEQAGSTAGNEQFGITFEIKPSAKPVEILVGSVTRTIDPRTNRPRLQATTKVRPLQMTEYGEFKATRRIKPPAAYLLKPDQVEAVNLLRTHGVSVDTTRDSKTLEVERYLIKEAAHASRSFQGHAETRLTVNVEQTRETFPAGSFIVSTHQAKAALIFYLLEPESDDGLANWNFFDKSLGGGANSVYPVYRLTGRIDLAK
jgi:zinc carboxypeptidase